MKNIKTLVAFSCLISSSALGTTLSESLISTYQNNPELIAAREELKIVDEQMSSAISGFLPHIDYAAQKQYNKSDTIGKSITTDGLETQTQYTKTDPWVSSKSKQSRIQIQQNVFNGGRSVMAIQIAKNTIEAARSRLTNTEQSIFLQTIQAFLNVILNKQILEINKENVTFYERKLEAVKQEVEAGIKKRSDAAEAEAAKANSYTRLAHATGGYEQALATYNKLVGIPADNLSLEKNLVQIPSNQLELLQKSLKTNPSLTSITYQQKAADIDVISNAAAMLPTVNIGGSIGKNWSQQTNYNAISQPSTNTKTVFVSVSVPIFQQGIEYSNIRKSSAKAANLKYTVKNAKADVTEKVTQAWSQYNVATASVKSSEEAVKAATLALEGVQQGYNEGVNTITELLTSQENLFQYQISLSKSKLDQEISRYSIAALTGDLTAKNMSLPTKIYNMSENYDKIKIKIIGF